MQRSSPYSGPRSNVHTIFEEFVSSLSALIKVKVSEAVQVATSDFFAAKFAPAAGEPKPVRKRRRRRRGGRRPAEEKVVGKPGRSQRKRGTALGQRSSPKRGPKPVKLSKHGKRLGRPPKAATEESKTE